jgi:flagellar basal body-associated protein FliL
MKKISTIILSLFLIACLSVSVFATTHIEEAPASYVQSLADIKNADDEFVFEFKDEDGNVVETQIVDMGGAEEYDEFFENYEENKEKSEKKSKAIATAIIIAILALPILFIGGIILIVVLVKKSKKKKATQQNIPPVENIQPLQ